MKEFKLTAHEVLLRYQHVYHKIAVAQKNFHEALAEFHRHNMHGVSPETKHWLVKKLERFVDELKDARNELERIN